MYLLWASEADMSVGIVAMIELLVDRVRVWIVNVLLSSWYICAEHCKIDVSQVVEGHAVEDPLIASSVQKHKLEGKT